jgi:hypothetical protein
MRRTSTFGRCGLRSEVGVSLRSTTGLYRSDDLAQSNGSVKHGEEPAREVTDNLPDIVPVTQKELEIIETYLAALVEEACELKEINQRVGE